MTCTAVSHVRSAAPPAVIMHEHSVRAHHDYRNLPVLRLSSHIQNEQQSPCDQDTADLPHCKNGRWNRSDGVRVSVCVQLHLMVLLCSVCSEVAPGSFRGRWI